MKIAYLINQYPKVSHSFVRREILALEKQGMEIVRYSIRPTDINMIVDPADKVELEKTNVILNSGIISLFLQLIIFFFLRPFPTIKAFK